MKKGGLVMMAIALLAGATVSRAVEPCPIDAACAEVAVLAPTPPANPGDTVLIRLSFLQGEDDQQPGGVDEVAALSLTIGMPGLELADCSPSGANGLNGSFVLLPGAATRYRVIVQNFRCDARESCLCPTDNKPRDAYANLLVVGLPGVGGVQRLPNGELVSIAMRVLPDAPAHIPLHLYSLLDDPQAFPPPPLSGVLSVADTGAVDRTVRTESDTLNVRISDGELEIAGAATPTSSATQTTTATATSVATATATDTQPIPPTGTATASATQTAVPPIATATGSVTASATATPTAAAIACVGDCDGNRTVTVNELITGVSIALDVLPLSRCPAFDCNGMGRVEIGCLVGGVNAALSGCPSQ
jgi:hypothetical protein